VSKKKQSTLEDPLLSPNMSRLTIRVSKVPTVNEGTSNLNISTQQINQDKDIWEVLRERERERAMVLDGDFHGDINALYVSTSQ
jgi:hypothetical protein